MIVLDPFFENNYQLKVINVFYKNSSSKIFIKFLYTSANVDSSFNRFFTINFKLILYTGKEPYLNFFAG